MTSSRCKLVGPFSSRVFPILFVAALVAGCGGDGMPVAARVNNQGIPAGHVDLLLAKAGPIPPGKVGEARRQALGRLVEQELLAQQATVAKLDRNPKVAQAIEAARREVLAVAYLEQVAAGAARPTADEVKAYYVRHPERFAERKIFRLVEIAISDRPENRAAVKEQLARGGALDDLLGWLRASNIPFRPESGVKTAEQLPPELLPRLHELRDGQAITLESPNGLLIVQVLATRPEPIDEKAATPAIENLLTGEKRKQLAAAELKKLKDGAKIEFVGEFADGAAAVSAEPGAGERQ